MMTYLGAIALKSLYVLAIVYLIAYPIKRFLFKKLKPGRLKNLLFYSWKS